MSTPITIVINGNSYRLSTDNPKAMRDMPVAERAQLINLLKVLNAQHLQAQQQLEQTVARQQNPVLQASISQPQTANDKPATGERMGKGDVEQMMARLIAGEKSKQKPLMTASTIYKFVGVVFLVIFLVSLF